MKTTKIRKQRIDTEIKAQKMRDGNKPTLM